MHYELIMATLITEEIVHLMSYSMIGQITPKTHTHTHAHTHKTKIAI